MSKKMLINATHPEENRVAIVEDGILTELDIEVAGREQTRGNIYKGLVVRVEPGLQAAFVDYGGDRFGFLQMGEIHPNYFKAYESSHEGKGRPRITDILHRGQELLLQVVKEERGTKGAALTTFLSLPGRYMVLMPDSDTKGVSRKIEEESQRKALKSAMASLDLPQNLGYIVRTAGIGQSKEELKRDFDYLRRVNENIQALAKKVKSPALIYKESNLVIRCIRDYFSADTDEVLVDDPEVFQEAKDFFQQVMPEYARLVKLHQERRPIFSRYQIEEQIETISKNKVPLPSGGSIVIDSTEALVAVDVNSGKMSGESGVEATAFRTNMEAAVEVGRQLRLRDLGGLIVIDFIDMRDRKHIREIEKQVAAALKDDKARVTVGRISQFGLLELSRQRIKAILAEGTFLPCPHCQGSGQVKSPEAQAIAFLRKLQAAAAKGQVGRIEGEVPLDVATYLLNSKREELLGMERRHNLTILVKGRPDFMASQAEVTIHKREKEEVAAEYIESSSFAQMPMTDYLEEAVVEAPEEREVENELPAGEEGGKKKRRRRRKKKKGSEDGGAPTEGRGEGEGEEDFEEGEAPEEEVPDLAAATEEGLPVLLHVAVEGESEEGVKRKRRRRRKKRPAEAAAEAALSGNGTDSPRHEEPSAIARPLDLSPPLAPAAPTRADVLPEAPAGGEKTRPERKRPPRAKKGVATADTPVAEEVTPPSPAAAAKETSEPAKKTRTPAKKTAPAKTPLPPADEAGAKPAEAKAAKKTATRAKPKAKVAATSKESPVKEGAAEKPAPKAAPRNRTRKGAAAPGAEEIPGAAAEKAKKRAPRKKAPKVETSESGE
ncbi:RNAse E [Desulfuromonas soudanensis]|uniref:Ribonuclease G n=1 Tax=Desulfuromonas soudanensis TaxID=1603606 RepID=A0A0M5INH8_9BACT|nr:Rne/Rng family ribonuclease [Desulfuromonas soudanensis]ALC16998.1 RNAse E [Desulfuromonas soudanensis]